MSEPSAMSPVSLEILKASFSLLVTLFGLVLAWVIGYRLSANWNLFQKQRETDIANIQQFYSLYGEFKEISKTWRLIKRSQDSSLKIPSDSRWLLLARSCVIESKNEAILVKLATERDLKDDSLKTLGLFRQALQQLRESIRDDKEIPFASRGTEYVFFNDLVAKAGFIISSSPLDKTLDQENTLQRLKTRLGLHRKASDQKSARERLKAIASVRSPDFKKEIELFKNTQPEYPDIDN
jgi:hypothetical protein